MTLGRYISEVFTMKFVLVAALLLAWFPSVAFSQGKTNKNEELIVLSCSGQQTGMVSEKEFKNAIIKIRKVNGEIVGVIVNDRELTKERRAPDPESPQFIRWFEKTSDGIITFGQQPSDAQPKWNIKLSSKGVFERQGYLLHQNGTCVEQKTMF